jgi:hypothetical protein
MLSQSILGIPAFRAQPWRRWFANSAAGLSAVLLGILTGEWVWPTFFGSPRSPGSSWPTTALPRMSAALSGDGMGLTLWAMTMVLVVFNLLAMFFFATILVPLLRRRARQADKDSDESAISSLLARSASSARLSSRATVVSGRNLSLQAGQGRYDLAQEQKKQQQEDILQHIFEQNLALRT